MRTTRPRLMTTPLTDNSTHGQVDSRTSRLIDNSTYCNKTRAWYFFFFFNLFIYFFKSLNLIFSCTEGSVESSRRNKTLSSRPGLSSGEWFKIGCVRSHWCFGMAPPIKPNIFCKLLFLTMLTYFWRGKRTLLFYPLFHWFRISKFPITKY